VTVLRPEGMLGPYRLVERTGSNELGEVWKAFRPGLRRSVAIKVLPRYLAAQPGCLEHFHRAAPALARLDHPNILGVHDFGEQDGRIYLVTPLISGLTLDYLLGAPWPAAEAALVLDPLASALDYAHARRIVHGDLKPSNVLVTDEGQVILGGFGLGWLLERVSTGRSDPMAPPRHLAPESASGGPASPAGDLYALGTIAFELLTGRPPFRVEVWPTELQARPTSPLPLPCSISPELPRPLVKVLFRALAQNPDERFPTAGALAFAVATAEHASSDDPVKLVRDAWFSTHPRQVALVADRPAAKPTETDSDSTGAAAGATWRGGWKRALGALAGVVLMIGLVYQFLVQPTVALLAGRGEHAAAVLTSGEVLVAGGCTNIPSSGSAAGAVRSLRSLGGKDNGPGWLDTAILFAPGGNSWSLAGRMAQARCDLHALPLANGRALVVGGSIGPGQPFVTAERYDRSTNTWTSAGKLLIARREYALTPLGGGQGLVVGGATAAGGEPLGSTERYDPSTNNWSLAAGLAQPRRLHTATLLPGGQILVAGGLGGKAGTLAGAERYDPSTNVWLPAGSMQQPRANHSATLLPDGQVLVVGGSGERRALTSAERYDPATDTWTRLASMSEARAGHAATLLPDGQVLVVAGSGLNGALASAERYDPAANAWLPAGSLSSARTGHTVSILPDGRVLVVGGRRDADGGPYLPTAELFDPIGNRWTPAADMPP
jgi:hypothetical protein